jgi:hypothetical protein
VPRFFQSSASIPAPEYRAYLKARDATPVRSASPTAPALIPIFNHDASQYTQDRAGFTPVVFDPLPRLWHSTWHGPHIRAYGQLYVALLYTTTLDQRRRPDRMGLPALLRSSVVQFLFRQRMPEEAFVVCSLALHQRSGEMSKPMPSSETV